MSVMESSVKKLYKERFNLKEIERKNRLWKTLCRYFFQRFVPEKATVLDLGAGYCEFINNIKAGSKIAVDLNEDTKSFSGSEVEVFNCSATDLSFITDDFIDVVFMSNFLEHMCNKDEVLKIILESYRVLKRGG